MRTFANIEAVEAATGEEVGVSDWSPVTQEKINTFAEATGDHQWIHVNEEMAKMGPFGGTIAHGYYTLSLAPVLLGQIWSVEGVKMGVNYGLNKLRFITPVKVGSNVRARATLKGCEPKSGGTAVTVEMTFEIEGEPKPAAVAEVIYLYFT